MRPRPIFGLTLLAFATLGQAQERIQDVIYTKHDGVALTFDVFKPAHPNGIGVIFVVSGGWVSSHAAISEPVAKTMTDKGITVFEVVHGTQPRFLVQEIVFDISRAVRYIRTNADKFGIQPNKIGIYGGSAGGHLSLMAAALGGDGNPTAPDPVDRTSSALNAVGAFFPPTDFQNFGKPGLNVFDNPMLRVLSPAFGVNDKTPRDKVVDLEKKLSPITYVSAKFPPTYVIQGDKDILVPEQQAHVFTDALKAAGVNTTLIIVPGAGHDPNLLVQKPGHDLADWFVKTLGG